MVARVTLAEIDAVRQSVSDAVATFTGSVIPALRKQPGYQGCYVLTTSDGKALVMTFWDKEADAEAGVASGAYAGHVERFATLFRAPPGRETYDVVVADLP